jgi:hypothetical protein
MRPPFEFPKLSQTFATTSAASFDGGPLGVQKMSVMFTLADGSGSLSKALKWFEKHNISMTRIESRPSKRNQDYEFFVDFKGVETDANVTALLLDLRQSCREVNILHSYEVPWFPRKVKEVILAHPNNPDDPTNTDDITIPNITEITSNLTTLKTRDNYKL